VVAPVRKSIHVRKSFRREFAKNLASNVASA
jgi:hypothetical protein